MSERHAEGETEEFQPVELVSPSVEFDLSCAHPLSLAIRPDFMHPIEVRFGDSRTPPCQLVHGREHPDFRADYVLLQPRVFRRDSSLGRVGIGGRGHEVFVRIGRVESPQLELRPEVSRWHCMIESFNHLILEDYSRNGTRIKLHPEDLDDIPFTWLNRGQDLVTRADNRQNWLSP